MKRELAAVIGVRGESIFELAVTDYSRFARPLFRPSFLGDKWPSVDYYVELLGVRDCRPFMFAQVKSTAQQLSPGSHDIEISLPKSNCLSLFMVPGPTYLAGIHEPTRRAFIVSVHRRPNQGVYRIPLKNELTPDNLRLLYNEVVEFWKSHPFKPFTSAFSS